MPENWPTETFADLAALAAKGDGRLLRAQGAPGDFWTYEGAPTTQGSNLKLPIESISGRRVWAAVLRGVWRYIGGDGVGGPAGLPPVWANRADLTKLPHPAGNGTDMWASDPSFLPPYGVDSLHASATIAVLATDPRASGVWLNQTTAGRAA